MAIIVKETRRRNRKGGETSSDEREYTLWGSASADSIEAALLSGANAYTDGALTVPFFGVPGIVNSNSIKTFDLTSRENTDDVWDVTVSWSESSEKPIPDIGDQEISFDISPQTIHVTQSLQTISRLAPAGKTATDHKGTIGVNGDKVDGVDIFVPSLSFTVTKTVSNDDISNSFIDGLVAAAFHWNDAPFRGGAIGEVLYYGTSGNRRDADRYSLSHKFVRAANIVGRTVGEITGIDAQAWDYLWAELEEVEDPASKAMAKRARAAYVERVYESANFPLNIGVGP